MTEIDSVSPAELAAQRALDDMFLCVRDRKSFRLEAGAGAGKTFSLVKALQLIIDGEAVRLLRKHQRVACITYTNVATEEITKRTDGHPVIHASTIHSFCWELLKNYQSVLREEISNIGAWTEKLEEISEIGTRTIVYVLGHRRVNDTEVSLHHDDVLMLMVAFLERPKFRRILAERFPILFIDEYQDTNAEFADSLIRNVVGPGEGPLIGLFGDSWQKIYRDGAGLIEHQNLQVIGKEANFRSVPVIVDVLNQIRPDLPQAVSDTHAEGCVAVYHSNEWVGQRRTGGHWAGDLPAEDAHIHFDAIKKHLSSEGWDFTPKKTKILMLTHNVLAAEQGYSQIVAAFQYKDSFIKKEDAHIAFLADTVEPACEAFSHRRYGKMFSVIGARSVNIKSIEEKRNWARDMKRLIKLRDSGSIGDVIDLLKETCRPRLPDAVIRTENRLAGATEEEIDESLTLKQISKLRTIPYTELISLAQFINDHTPFSTKHGVKGAEFENVLVIFGRGWNQYNWNQFLEWYPDNYPEDRGESYLRNRNLFYVACSRPKRRLALLFTQELSIDALETLRCWFGAEKVIPFTPG